jgi:hypothetical protein
MNIEYMAPAFIRGQIVVESPQLFGAESARFRAPDPQLLFDRLPLADPVAMRALYTLSVADIADFLAEVGDRLRLDDNEILREALDRLGHYSDLTPSVLRSTYQQLPSLFARDVVLEVAERSIGVRFLDGWAESGAGRVRAFGARSVHVIAGNNPIIAAITVVRNAITRGDAIIKLPANDPFTAVAIAQTMAGVDPNHPLVKHLSVAYWRGGDERFESALYRPANLDKIVAWGGFASVRHVTRYLQPGLELIALDPKLSATVIGPEAFADEAVMTHVADLAAADVGMLNQDGCFNARVLYICTGTDSRGLDLANRWGAELYARVVALPETVSTPPAHADPALRADLAAVRTNPQWYRVIGGANDEAAVVISQLAEPVDFHETLAGRVANVVPIDHPEQAIRSMNAYTQTVGVYPESLKAQLRDLIPLYGAQRLVSLGYATHFHPALPQDGMEPIRRMVKWIVDESYDPATTHPFDQLCPAASQEATPR